MRQKEVGKAFGSVLKFNDIAGQLLKPDKNSIALQLDLIQEEYLEGVEAFDNSDEVEILDSAIDMWVVVSGLLQKLEAQGYNVEEGIRRVCENNLSKFSTEVDLDYICAKEFKAERNKKHNVWVVRNGNQKIMKPAGFVPVDLSDLIPGVA